MATKGSNSQILAVLSGGMDSAVALAMAIDVLKPERVGAVHFEYTQNHLAPENEAYFALCHYFNLDSLERHLLCLPGIGASSLTSTETRIKNHSLLGVPATYIPNRNMILIAHAAALAIENGYDTLCIGVHEEDAEYPDCTATFVNVIRRALAIGTAGAVGLQAPVIKMSKAAIVKVGLTLGVPFELTWTCYNPQKGVYGVDSHEWLACGECPACKLRQEAFIANGRYDPIAYVGKGQNA